MKRWIALLFAGWSLAAGADFEAGLVAYERGDFARALREWRPLAEQGHLRARFRLGVMHLRGEGVAKDRERALAWFDFEDLTGANARSAPVREIRGGPPAGFGRSGVGLHAGAIPALAGTFDLAEAVASYGDDYRREDLGNGRVRFLWTYTGTTLARERIPASPGTSARGMRERPRLATGTCRLAIVTDPDGHILEAGVNGNACPSVLDLPEAWREDHPLYLTRPPAPVSADRRAAPSTERE